MVGPLLRLGKQQNFYSSQTFNFTSNYKIKAYTSVQEAWSENYRLVSIMT